EAVRRSGVQEMTLSGQPFHAKRVTAARDGTLRDLYGALAPIAVMPAAGGECAITPGRDERVARGDEVTLLGTPEELEATFPERASASRSPRPRLAAARGLRRLSITVVGTT